MNTYFVHYLHTGKNQIKQRELFQARITKNYLPFKWYLDLELLLPNSFWIQSHKPCY